MLLRVCWLGREIFTLQLMRQDPMELLARAVAGHQDRSDEDDDEEEPEVLILREIEDSEPWFSTSSDPEDHSRVLEWNTESPSTEGA